MYTAKAITSAVLSFYPTVTTKHLTSHVRTDIVIEARAVIVKLLLEDGYYPNEINSLFNRYPRNNGRSFVKHAQPILDSHPRYIAAKDLLTQE